MQDRDTPPQKAQPVTVPEVFPEGRQEAGPESPLLARVPGERVPGERVPMAQPAETTGGPAETTGGCLTEEQKRIVLGYVSCCGAILGVGSIFAAIAYPVYLLFVTHKSQCASDLPAVINSMTTTEMNEITRRNVRFPDTSLGPIALPADAGINAELALFFGYSKTPCTLLSRAHQCDGGGTLTGGANGPQGTWFTDLRTGRVNSSQPFFTLYVKNTPPGPVTEQPHAVSTVPKPANLTLVCTIKYDEIKSCVEDPDAAKQLKAALEANRDKALPLLQEKLNQYGSHALTRQDVGDFFLSLTKDIQGVPGGRSSACCEELPRIIGYFRGERGANETSSTKKLR